MFGRLLIKYILKNKVITATLFLFILVSAMLVSSAVHIVITLFGSIDNLFEQARPPHFVQMTSEEINRYEIDIFAQNNPLVESHQVVDLLGIDGANIYIGNNTESKRGSIIDNSFVIQNSLFDFLLDTDSNIIQVNNGEIAAPIFHMQQYDLQIGDTVRIVDGDFDMTFTITAFVRDAQMNPSIVTSKRWVISESDWQKLYYNAPEMEHLISFRLHDGAAIGEFEAMYQASNLPQTGIAITYPLFRMLNAITDGVLAAAIALISLILVTIAVLCLNFTLIASIEEDFREIGVMKAIGINGKEIRRLYMVRYMAIATVACILGYGIAYFAGGLFTANIALYMGSLPETIWSRALPSLGALVVFLTVTAFCSLILRKFKKISAVEAMRDIKVATGKAVGSFRLSRSNFKNIHIFLGVKAVLNRFRMYWILCFIFIAAIFLMVVPINLLNTLQSPDFVTYMGVGRSDIRMDIATRQNEDIVIRYREIDYFLSSHTGITNHAVMVTAAYRVLNQDGLFENIRVEIGDFSAFPLNYTAGHKPTSPGEIALSHMNAVEFGVNIGDTITLLVGDEQHSLTVVGIYNDITYGGRTAKGLLPYLPENILWVVINIAVAESVSVPMLVEELGMIFPNVSITSIDEYISQTMGGLIGQLSVVAILGFGLGLLLSALITAMLFKMLIAKDISQIAIMRSIGIPYRSICLQYVAQAATVLTVGLVIGSIAAVVLGQELAGMLIPGVSTMRFIINPVLSYVVSPVALGLVVVVTVFVSCVSVKKISVMKMTR
ncbi:MAG: ABC transporter permease [Defluviitaleaceae bacterium]|nr:ABC transporter permease [Defluviitaleaceae bacterium]